MVQVRENLLMDFKRVKMKTIKQACLTHIKKIMRSPLDFGNSFNYRNLLLKFLLKLIQLIWIALCFEYLKFDFTFNILFLLLRIEILNYRFLNLFLAHLCIHYVLIIK
jgi:hypothetical protein